MPIPEDNRSAKPNQARGIVFLVGAGPGDPDLLTVKALRLIRAADVAVYDRLVSPEILDLIPQGVARMAVGKAPGLHCVPQEEINQRLLSLATKGRRVVRLKGGDPFIFGRGSEEALFLRRHGIAFEVVPGITAAASASAYAGIPLTHRGMSRGVRMLTGHFKEDEALAFDWSALAESECTLVIYMGLANLDAISRHLIAAGMPAATPAAAIQEGTTPRQRQVLSTLGGLQTAVEQAGLCAPVMIIIGDTVTLAEQLDWRQAGADTALAPRAASLGR